MIDLRSDTVTRPTVDMLEAMTRAEVGDDVLGDDPTVHRLEEHVALLLGKEAACFVPTGTMANQTAIRALTEPGDEVIAHRDSHIIHYETGAPAALCGCGIFPLDGPGGVFEPEDVARAIRPADFHYPRSRLLVIENTHNRGGGTVWPLEQFVAVCAEARRHDLRIHLDGARLMNACAALGCAPTEFTSHVDTVSICFSKGLGTPAGSAVAGARDVIQRVRRFRKMFGGTMRQSGLLAAACLHALAHHVQRLNEDHAHAALLADRLASVRGITVDATTLRTNMVFIRVDPALGPASTVTEALERSGVRALALGHDRIRFVTHLDVSRSQVEAAAEAVASAIAALTSAPV